MCMAAVRVDCDFAELSVDSAGVGCNHRSSPQKHTILGSTCMPDARCPQPCLSHGNFSFVFMACTGRELRRGVSDRQDSVHFGTYPNDSGGGTADGNGESYQHTADSAVTPVLPSVRRCKSRVLWHTSTRGQCAANGTGKFQRCLHVSTCTLYSST